MELLTPFVLKQFFALCDGCILIIDGCWMKIIFTQISSCMKVFNSEKIWCDHLFVHKVMFIVGYYNEFTVMRIQIVIKLFVKDNLYNHRFFT